MDLVTVGFYVGFACILAGLWIYVIALNGRIRGANENANKRVHEDWFKKVLNTLDNKDEKIEKNVERLANHFGLDYPPKEHITPAIPEKRVIKWEKLKK